MLWLYRIFSVTIILSTATYAEVPFNGLPNCQSTTCESVYNTVVKPLCSATKLFSIGMVADGQACTCPCHMTTVPQCQKHSNPNKIQDLNIDISPMFHPSRRFIQFYISNHHSTEVFCCYIRISVKYINSRNKEIGRRDVSINNQALKPNTLEFKVEAGQEIIEQLEAQYDTPSIDSIVGEVKHHCFFMN